MKREKRRRVRFSCPNIINNKFISIDIIIFCIIYFILLTSIFLLTSIIISIEVNKWFKIYYLTYLWDTINFSKDEKEKDKEYIKGLPCVIGAVKRGLSYCHMTKANQYLL